MADRLGLSRPTVRRAIQELVGQGLLLRRRGLGTTVAGRQIHRRAELTSLYDDLRREGSGDPRTQVLTHEVTTDEVAATALGLPVDTPLLKLVRLRLRRRPPTRDPAELAAARLLRHQPRGPRAQRPLRPAPRPRRQAGRRAPAHRRPPAVGRRAQAPRSHAVPAGPDHVAHRVRRRRRPGRVRRPLLPRPGLLHRGHARRALTAPPLPVECPLPHTAREVCRVVPCAARRPPGAAPSVTLVRAEPALGRARDRVDRLALRRVAAGLDDSAGRGRRVADPGLGRRVRRHLLDRKSIQSGRRAARPTRTSTSSTSRRRTTCTGQGALPRSRPASTCSSRSPSASMPLRHRRSRLLPRQPASSAWRRCGRSSCRASTSCGRCSTPACSVTCAPSSPTTASTSTRRTASSTPPWRAGRSSTSAPT